MNDFNPYQSQTINEIKVDQIDQEYLNEITYNKISLNKTYPVSDAEVAQFYNKSLMFTNLKEQLQRRQKNSQNDKELVSGLLKFIKIKYDEYLATIQTPEKFNRLTPTAKVTYLKHLTKFCK